jgi:hypothetical protein
MANHLIIDAGRQPPQIHCTLCGAAQDLPLPMPIHQLDEISRDWHAQHRRCKPRQERADV